MTRDVPILLVEDDVLDVKNVRRAFGQHDIINPLHVVSNGEEALAFLRHQPPYDDASAAPRPGLILLDLNMPVMGGIEFLAQCKADATLRTIPAVILTTSDQERDRADTYRLGAAGYIVKPVEFSKFLEAIRRLDLYWSLCATPS